MPMLRYDEMVPDVYVQQSRDFQVLTRLFTIGLSNSKYFADKLKFQNSPKYIEDTLLILLQEKVGFYTSKNFSANELRNLLEVFYSLVRNKGSLSSIEQAIRLFFQIQNLNTNAYININNKNTTIDSYTIQIGIDSSIRDITLLTEILKYIIPTGYIISIFFYEHTAFDDYITTHDDLIIISSSGDDRSALGTDKTIKFKNDIDTTTIFKQHDNGEINE